MTGKVFDIALAWAFELIVQTVPPAILAAWAAWQVSLHTAATFAEAAGVITAFLLACATFQATAQKN